MIFWCPTSRQIHTNTNTNTKTKTKTSNSICPQNLDVISVLVGCLLGDAYAVKVQNKKYIPGTKFRFKQSGRHKAYFFYMNFFIIEDIVQNPGLENIKQSL